MENIIECRNLSHYYGKRMIYENLSFGVPKGHILGLLGKNGTGKTTTINILSGYLEPRNGKCMIFGEDIRKMRPGTKAKIGLLIEGHVQYEFMTIKEIERFYSAFYPKWKKEAYYELIGKLKVAPGQRISRMSCGQRSQVALGLILAQNPDLLVLDDFSLGLDPGYRRLFVDYLREYAKAEGKTVFLTSHIIQDMERLVDDCIIMDYGKILIQCPTKEILDNFREKRLQGIIETVPYPTGTVQVTLDNEGVPCYDIKEGVAWDNIPYTEELDQLARQTQAVCFGSLAQRSIVSRETIARFLATMPDTPETLKIFDINLRQSFYTKEILCDSFSRCNVLKINDEELVTVSRLFGYPGIDLQDKCWILLAKYNLKMLILTCGVNGSYVFTPGHVSFVETPTVQVADTVGAGDSFTAAFTAAIIRGRSVREAHQLAVDTSAYVCTQQGAMPVLPESLTSRLA